MSRSAISANRSSPRRMPSGCRGVNGASRSDSLPGTRMSSPERRHVEHAVDAVDLGVLLAVDGEVFLQLLLVDEHVEQVAAHVLAALPAARLRSAAAARRRDSIARSMSSDSCSSMSTSLSRVMRNVVVVRRFEAAEQLGQLAGDDVFQQHELVLARAADVDEPRQHLRHLHDGEQLRRAQAAGALQQRRQVQPAVVEPRAGMAGVDRHRRENRERPLAEELVDDPPLRLVAARRP